MSYREPADEPVFVGELTKLRSSPLARLPESGFLIVGPVAAFAALGVILAKALDVSPLFTVVPLVFTVLAVVALALKAYWKNLQPRVTVYADRVVFSTSRRTLVMPRSGLVAIVERRRCGRATYTCISVTGGDGVSLMLGTPTVLKSPSGTTGCPHLQCDERTLRDLARALKLSLPTESA